MVFAEIFLDNVRVPVADRLGDEGQGWHVCMATAGFERGLLLRSPARYQVAASQADRAVRSATRTDLPASMAERVAQHWMDAEAYALAIYAMASRLDAGGTIGPEASTNKIFWSELDIALHQTALDILGAARRTCSAARRRRCRRLARRLHLRARRADLCRLERNPAQHHRRAHARPAEGLKAMQFAFTEDQLAITEAAREMLVETCTPADLRQHAGERRRARRCALGDHPRHGPDRHARAGRRGRPGPGPDRPHRHRRSGRLCRPARTAGRTGRASPCRCSPAWTTIAAGWTRAIGGRSRRDRPSGQPLRRRCRQRRCAAARRWRRHPPRRAAARSR